MWRQSEAHPEHPREVVFRQRTQPRQLPEADRLGQLAVDELHQLPALMRRQPALEAQAVAYADLAQQGLADQFVGQAAGQQPLARLVPIESE